MYCTFNVWEYACVICTQFVLNKINKTNLIYTVRNPSHFISLSGRLYLLMFQDFILLNSKLASKNSKSNTLYLYIFEHYRILSVKTQYTN